jgi:peroxiredoxin
MSGLLVGLSMLPLKAAAPVPRVAPELKLVDASGNETSLSSFRGKVVLVEFLLTNCPHCARVARTLDQLQHDLGPRGFQAVGIAIETGIRAPMVNNFTEDAKIALPIGHALSDQVDRFLERSGKDQFQVPQLVLIDREGVIRAQSKAVGETLLENPGYLRKTIESVVQETGHHTSTSRPWMNSTVSSIAILMLVVVFLIWIREGRQKHRRGVV